MSQPIDMDVFEGQFDAVFRENKIKSHDEYQGRDHKKYLDGVAFAKAIVRQQATQGSNHESN